MKSASTPGSRLRRALSGAALLATALVVAALPGTSQGEPKKKPAPLAGATYDYEYDGKDIGHPERAWLGRAYVHPKAAADPEKPLPILVFIHGLNTELIRYRWMGGGNEGDVRRIVGDLIDRGDLPPVIVAAPSTIMPAAATVARTSWPAFDLDNFLALTAQKLKGVATIDPQRVIVAGHSGGGCNAKGGLATAVHARAPVRAALAIDTCMEPDFAAELARARPTTHVIVSWQTLSWSKRPISRFKSRFTSELASAAAPGPGILRELDETRPTEPSPHDAMVGLTLKKWLPKLVGGGAAAP
jgi:hypothetical protein